MSNIFKVSNYKGSGLWDGRIDLSVMKETAMIYRAFNHPFRQKLLLMLDEKGATSVSEMVKAFRIDQSVCSNQLGILRRAGLVDTLRKGKNIYYSVNYSMLKTIHSTAVEILTTLHVKS